MRSHGHPADIFSRNPGFAPGSLRLVTALALALAIGAVPARAGDLGETDFPTSGTASAQVHFLEGLLALHSFEYRDAREAFQKARAVEPGFAMAAWGEAMTYNHPLWLREDRDAAVAALAELAPSADERRALAPTEREKGYLGAVEILFGDGDKLERDLAYAEAMGRLAAAHPEDLDAASFHALALLGTCHSGRDHATYMRAAAIVEEVFARNPRHPGAAHYLIHSYDDPVHAPLGLRPARVYAEIAPAAEHALHMPSHIFLALGMWEETAASNVASYEAGEARRARLGQGVDQRGYHALLWLHYAHLQMGRFEEARQLLDLVARDNEELGGERTRGHLALMRAAHVVETRAWLSGCPELPEGPDLDGLSHAAAASDLFATGYAAVRCEDLEAAEAQLAALGERYEAAAAGADEKSEGYVRFGPVDLVPVRLMQLELEALIRFERGEVDEALALLEEAAEAEDERPFGFGPPVPAKPARELLGETLIAAGRLREARGHFESALARTPRRVQSLQGLVMAARRTGDDATARSHAEMLRAIRSNADDGIPGSQTAPGAGR